MDVFGKVIAAILVVFMVLINPLQYMFESNESVKASFVEAHAKEFSDYVCSEGKITREQYEQLKDDLSNTGDIYKIELEHSHAVYGIEVSEGELMRFNHKARKSYHATIVASHIHTDACYAGTKHVHSGSSSSGTGCYTRYVAGSSYSCGSVSFDRSTGSYSTTCSRCGRSATGTYYEGTCSGCGQTCSSGSRVVCSSCGYTMLNVGGHTISSQSHYEINCGKTEGNYYDSDGTEVSICCDKIIKNIVAISPIQSLDMGSPISVKAMVHFMNGTSEMVDCTTNFTTNIPGENQTAVLTYNGYASAADVGSNHKSEFSCNVSVTVINPKRLENIIANLYATTIPKYSEFPITNLTLNYSDGTSEIVTTGWETNGFVNTAKGNYTVTLSYTVQGMTCYTQVNLTVENLSKLCNVCGNPYFLNDNDYDTGCPYCKTTIDHIYLSNYDLTQKYGQTLELAVYVVYKDGHTEAVTGWTSTYNAYNVGDQIVTVTYGDYSDKLIVRIEATVQCPICGYSYSLNTDGSNPGCSICKEKVSSIRATPEYSLVENGGKLELTVEATYVDGHKEVVTGWNSNFLNYRLGSQSVTITYQGQTTQVTVEVIKDEHLIACEICGNTYDRNTDTNGCPYCSTSIDHIEAYLLSDGSKVQLGSDLKLRIIITYKDAHRSLAYSGYAVENYEKNKLGRQTVQVEYKGHHSTLKIEVVNTIEKVVCQNGHVYSLNEDGSDPGCPYCSDTTTAKGISYINVIYTSNILETLYTTGSYEIPAGDYFTIVVTKEHRAFTVRNSFLMYSDFLGPNKKFTYGGEVA